MKHLRHFFRQPGAILITAIAIILFVSSNCRAQSFTNVPNDTIIATGTMDVADFYNISQQDNSADSIYLQYEKVSVVLPDQWEALICDNITCFIDLAQSGDMAAVSPGQDGFLSLHVTPHLNPGTAIIRYAVWDISNPVLRDTLTWIISVGETGINSLSQSATSIFISGNQLMVQKSDPAITRIQIFNLEGKTFVESSFTGNEISLDVSNFMSGVYLVEARDSKTIFTRKIFIQ